ncbi:MAG: hypothetical protein KKA28_20345 [Planctomycetes bacterium]|nr:hypothetical protein [Planctomycetota bacterium]
MAMCLECGKAFEPIKPNQKFCPGGICRSKWNNKKLLSGIHISPRLRDQLQSVADAQGIPIDEMANVMLAKVLNPDGRPLDDADIYGK